MRCVYVCAVIESFVEDPVGGHGERDGPGPGDRQDRNDLFGCVDPVMICLSVCPQSSSPSLKTQSEGTASVTDLAQEIDKIVMICLDVLIL